MTCLGPLDLVMMQVVTKGYGKRLIHAIGVISSSGQVKLGKQQYMERMTNFRRECCLRTVPLPIDCSKIAAVGRQTSALSRSLIQPHIYLRRHEGCNTPNSPIKVAIDFGTIIREDAKAPQKRDLMDTFSCYILASLATTTKPQQRAVVALSAVMN